MKYFVAILMLILTTSVFAQGKGKVVIDERSGKPMPVGEFNRDVFNEPAFSSWYSAEYNHYDVDTATLSKNLDKLEDIYIKVVMGAWCSDSRREVPRFLKILDYLHFDDENLELVMVNRSKEALDEQLNGLGVLLVPTFIIYKDGKEMDRIIEIPSETLEKDFVKILKSG